MLCQVAAGAESAHSDRSVQFEVPSEGPGIRKRRNPAVGLELNMIPVVPPKSNRREPWDYDRELYKKRIQVERLFRRLKAFRRILSFRETRRYVSGLALSRFHHRGSTIGEQAQNWISDEFSH